MNPPLRLLAVLCCVFITACGPAAPSAAPPATAPGAPTTPPAPPAPPTSAPASTPLTAPAPTAASAPAVTPAAAHASTKTELRWRNESDPNSLRPAKAGNNIEADRVKNNIFSSLFRYEPETNKIVPDLAERYETSQDGLTWTFHLKHGVKFQKGYGELTADDAKYSIDWGATDPQSGVQEQWSLLDHVDVIDPYTLQIVMKQPTASLLHKLTNVNSGWVVSKKAATDLGGDFDRNPIGSGPYQLDHWTPKAEIALTAFDEYVGGPSSIKKVTFVPISEESVAEVGLANGELDGAAGIRDPGIINRLAARSDMATYIVRDKNVASFVFNCGVAPLDRVEVRQALLMAIDRESMARDFWGGYRGVATSVMTRQWPEYTDDVKKYAYDPAGAKQLLAQAGLSNGFNLTLTMSNSGDSPDVAAVVKSYWDAIGVNTTLDIRDRAAYASRFQANVQATQTFPTGPADADYVLRLLYHKSAFPPVGQNLCRYDKVSDLIDDADRTLDPAARTAKYQQIQRMLAEDLPSIPISTQHYVELLHKNVRGLAMDVNAMAYFHDMWTE